MSFLENFLNEIDRHWGKWILYVKMNFKEKDLKSGQKIKSFKFYTHFSKTFSDFKEITVLRNFLLSSNSIKNHSFKPLLFFIKKTPRFKREIIDDNKKYRKLVQDSEKPWKNRPLMYADHMDTLIYSWYGYILAAWYESKLVDLWIQDCVVAYRNDNSRRTNSSIAKDMFGFLRWQDTTKKYRVMLFDVKKFYDTLDPKILKKMWCYVLDVTSLPDDHFAVYKSIINYSVAERNKISMYLNNRWVKLWVRKIGKLCTEKEFHDMRKDGLFMKKADFLSYISPFIDPKKPNEFYELTKWRGISKWIPQGLTISPILANIYMLNFDYFINQKIRKVSWFYRRYADDMCVICEEQYADEIEKEFTQAVEGILCLIIQEDKTQKYIYANWEIEKANWVLDGDKKAFTYLGLTYRWDKGYIRNGTISKWHQKLRKILKQVYWRKKEWEEITSADACGKIMSMWLFRYIKMCAIDHGYHIYKQFSKKKIKKFAKTALEDLDQYWSKKK